MALGIKKEPITILEVIKLVGFGLTVIVAILAFYAKVERSSAMAQDNCDRIDLMVPLLNEAAHNAAVTAELLQKVVDRQIAFQRDLGVIEGKINTHIEGDR